jgi:hypothetical protein
MHADPRLCTIRSVSLEAERWETRRAHEIVEEGSVIDHFNVHGESLEPIPCGAGIHEGEKFSDIVSVCHNIG